MGAKVFKTIDEQVEILKSKGLVIDDEANAKDILLRENYFFLNAYRSVFISRDGTRKFIPGTTFDELYSLFKFDRQIRNIIFKNILIIENNYKSMLSYVLSKSYGYKERDYLNPNNFDNTKAKSKQINDLLRKLKRQIRINATQNRATSHYINNYGYIPLWVSVKVLSFGIISELYSVLKPEDQNQLASMYHIKSADLLNYLPILANYRNLCAHEDILFDHRTQKAIDDTKYHTMLQIELNEEDEYIYGKRDLFALILILKSMLSADDFKMLMNELIYEFDSLEGKLKSISIDVVLRKMGFPNNYKEVMYIEK